MNISGATTEIELDFGYQDVEGNWHDVAVMRMSTMDDHIRAEAYAEKLKYGNKEFAAEGFTSTAQEAALLAECCVKLGNITSVTPDQIRALVASDHRKLVSEYLTWEQSLIKKRRAEKVKRNGARSESREKSESD